jgi:Putative transmembrane protein (PGPGW)
MQEFGDPLTQKPPTMRSHTSGSPACASESNAATLKGPLKRVAILALGWSLVLSGIVGLFLPIVPGGFLIVAGALMLSPQCAWLRRALEKCRARSHDLGRLVQLRCAQSRWRKFEGEG